MEARKKHLPLSPAAQPESHMRAYQCYKYQRGNRRHNLLNQHLVYLRDSSVRLPDEQE
jgi:hypothetical protein